MPVWSETYDIELLALSDRIDMERRMKIFEKKGTIDSPCSDVFLRAKMPIVMEEDNFDINPEF